MDKGIPTTLIRRRVFSQDKYYGAIAEIIHTPRPPSAKVKVLAKAMKEGVYCMSGVSSVLILSPPLTISKEEINFAMEVFDKALRIADTEIYE